MSTALFQTWRRSEKTSPEVDLLRSYNVRVRFLPEVYSLQGLSPIGCTLAVTCAGCSSTADGIIGATEPGPHPERQLASLSLLQQERQTRCQGPFCL